MSQTGGDSSAVIKPARMWYWVAAALFVGSLIPAFFLARNGVDTIDLSVDPIDGDTVEVRDEQLSVFSAPPYRSLPYPVTCTVTPPGGQPIQLDMSSNDVTIDGRERVGLIPEDLPAGSYELRCTTGKGAISLDGFGVRSTDGWTQAILMIVAAVVIPGVAGLTAVTIAVITAVRRSSARRHLLRPPPPPYGPAGYPPPPAS